MLAIPKDAPDPDSAYAFMNYMMDPQVIADISNFKRYANANAAAQAAGAAGGEERPGDLPAAGAAPETRGAAGRFARSNARHHPRLAKIQDGSIADDDIRRSRRKRSPGMIRPHALCPGRAHHQVVRRLQGGRRCQLEDLQGRDLLPAGRLGLRQDHVAAHAGRLRNADLGQDIHRRRGHDRRAALRAAGQHDVPVLRAVSAHECGAERRLRPEAGPPAQGRDQRTRGHHARSRQDGRLRQAQAASAVRRPAAARGAGALAGQAPEAAAAR